MKSIILLAYAISPTRGILKNCKLEFYEISNIKNTFYH